MCNRLVFLLAVGITLFPLTVAAEAPAAAPVSWPHGKALFEKKCSLCHAVGQGNEKMAASLHIAPAKLDLSQSHATANQIESLIRKGHNKMPALHYLSDADIKELIAYVQSLRLPTTARAP